MQIRQFPQKDPQLSDINNPVHQHNGVNDHWCLRTVSTEQHLINSFQWFMPKSLMAISHCCLCDMIVCVDTEGFVGTALGFTDVGRGFTGLGGAEGAGCAAAY